MKDKLSCKDCKHFGSLADVLLKKPKKHQVMYCRKHTEIYDDFGEDTPACLEKK